MSCFVINKQAYARVGAVLGAFTEIESSYREPILYKYNFKKGKLSDWEDIQSEIVELYNINLKSVSESWEEELTDTDTINQNECVKYKDYIKKLWIKRYSDIKYGKELSQILYDVHHFFRSVSYQIDNMEMNEQANVIIGRYSNYLLEIMKTMNHVVSDNDCWGDFKLAIE